MALPINIDELNAVSPDWKVLRPATALEIRTAEAFCPTTKAVYWVVACKHCGTEDIKTTNNIRRSYTRCKTCVEETKAILKEERRMKKETKRATGSELIACDGRTMTIKQWSKVTGVPAADILERFNQRDKTGAYGYGIIYGSKLPEDISGWVEQIKQSVGEVLTPNIMRIAQSLRTAEQAENVLLMSLAGANFRVTAVDQTISEMLLEGLSIAEVMAMLSCESFESSDAKREALSELIENVNYFETGLTELEIMQLLSIYKFK